MAAAGVREVLVVFWERSVAVVVVWKRLVMVVVVWEPLVMVVVVSGGGSG